MRTVHVIFLSVFICINSNAQSYSQLINLGIDNNNLIQDACFFEDSLFLATAHICFNGMQCTSLSSYDFNSKTTELHHLFETREIGNNHGLLIEPQRKVISFHNDTGALNGFFVQVLSNDYDSISFTEFFTDQDTMRYINDGILKHKGDYYVWGEGANDAIGEPNGHIIKLDSSLTVVKDAWYFNRGTFRSYLNDLQVQPDGNLAFLIKSDGPPGSITERTDSLHLIKIDTSGNIIKEITIEEGMDIKEYFYTLRNGNYVIMNFRETIYGRVQCLDHETGEVVWDWELPKGNFNEFNRFSIRDYVEMSNGDIVVCGLVQEVLDGIWDRSRFTAIAARLSPEGELIWFRRFLVPNETNPEEKGPYHFDILKRVFEREDGTLCFLGESTQHNLTPPHMQYAWILALDEEDCYKGNCSDTIVVDKRLVDKPKIEIGAKWTYETIDYIRGLLDFVVYEVTDTLTIDTLSCYIIEQNLSGRSDTLCVDGNRMLTPDQDFESGYQLLYDFDVDSTFNFDCMSGGGTLYETQIEVDSVVTATIADGQLITARFLSGECHFGFRGPYLRIFDGIGAAQGGLLRCIDYCDDLSSPTTFEIGELRCFENSTESFRFVDYACDSILIRTSTEDVLRDPFILYPNPTDDIVYIQNPEYDLSYRLTNIHGQVVAQGIYTTLGVVLPSQGVFFITLISDEGEWTERVVRY